MSDSDETPAITLGPEFAIDAPAASAVVGLTAPARSPLGPVAGGLILFAYVVAQIIAGAIAGVAGAVYFIVRRGHPYPEVVGDVQRHLLMPTAVFGLVVAGLVAGSLTALALRGSGRTGWQSIGWRSTSSRSVLFAGLGGVAIGALYLFAEAYIPDLPGQPVGPMTAAVAGGGWARHLWAVLAVVLAPPIEEFVFRGVLFGGLSRSWSRTSAGAFVTVVFLCAHLSEVWGHPSEIASVSAVALVLLFARIQTGSLLPGVVLHACYNLVVVIGVYAGTT